MGSKETNKDNEMNQHKCMSKKHKKQLWGGKEKLKRRCVVVFSVQIKLINLYLKKVYMYISRYTVDSVVLYVFEPLTCDSFTCLQNCDADCDLMRIAAA